MDKKEIKNIEYSKETEFNPSWKIEEIAKKLKLTIGEYPKKFDNKKILGDIDKYGL